MNARFYSLPGLLVRCVVVVSFIGTAAATPKQSNSESPNATFAIAGRAGVGMPACEYCPDPKYSKEAKKKKFEGVVILKVVITKDGKAADIQVVKSPGMGLDEAAIEAVRNWRFKPATKDGKPVPTQVPVEVTFRLHN